MLKKSENFFRDSLIDAIKKRNVRIAVLGAGYVGLPTAALFAEAGFDVTAADIKAGIIEKVNQGVSPISEPGLTELIARNVRLGKLRAEFVSEVTFSNVDVAVITVQTPIGENKEPDLSFLINALMSVGSGLKKKSLVTLCSTVPPGTLHGKAKPLLESLSGLKAESDFFLAYVPERIAPGNAIKEYIEGPRLAGGVGSHSTKVAAILFRTVCKKIVETEAQTAEVSKTAENTFRDVNIAFANQLALICEQHGADITKVIALANTHPRVNIHTPGPGVGGPCLTKDPYLLIHGTEFNGKNVVKASREVNDYMPHHLVKLVFRGLQAAGKCVDSCQIAVLGTAYKANIDDPRVSPSEPIVHELLASGANLTVFDPYCTEYFGAKRAGSLSGSLKGSDCLMIVTDHSEFKNLSLSEVKELMNSNPVIVDGKRIFNPAEAESLGFAYYGVGYGKLASSAAQAAKIAKKSVSVENRRETPLVEPLGKPARKQLQPIPVKLKQKQRQPQTPNALNPL
ncbi:MAG: nucleotide sugar dehydrogenase [Candidatus Bathyarchaeota archaeon]|nr:nucleotide sugar dehydrogenase [Candidatus Bathyarchaeota archaeon]